MVHNFFSQFLTQSRKGDHFDLPCLKNLFDPTKQKQGQAGAQLCQAQAQLGYHAETTSKHNLHLTS